MQYEMGETPILLKFVQHSHDHTDVQWLSAIVDGLISDGTNIPHGEYPLDHLLGVFRRRADRDQALTLAAAAGHLLGDWLSAHAEDPSPSDKAFERLNNILYILETVPAPPGIADRLYWFCQDLPRDADGKRAKAIRRRAIRALAISAPPHRDAESLAQFYVRCIDDPEYAVAAFAALVRLSLHQAVTEMTRLLRTLEKASLAPEHILWSLFRDLEHNPVEAQHLGMVIRHEGKFAAYLNSILGERVQAPDRFPKAWQAYKDGLSMGDNTDTKLPAMISPHVEPGKDRNRRIQLGLETVRQNFGILLAPVA